jgi:hypothetical protein
MVMVLMDVLSVMGEGRKWVLGFCGWIKSGALEGSSLKNLIQKRGEKD